MNTVTFPNLGFEFELSKSISIFGFDIAWYAILMAVGFMLGALYAFSRMKEFGINPDRAIDAIIVGMIGGVVGARLYYVAFQWDLYKDDLMSIFKTWEGGMAFYGSVIGGLGLGLIACRLRKVKILPMVDLTMMGFLIGQSIGRWGNFINVEAYGYETDSLFAMGGTGISGTVHPCFLYESVWCIVGFVLLHLYSKKRKFDGEITLMYAMWYGVGRAIIEGLRTDSLYIGQLRVSQILSVVMVIVAFIIWINIRSKIKRNNDPEYLKIYGQTEEAKQKLLDDENKIAQAKAKKEAKKAGITLVEKSSEDDVLEDEASEQTEDSTDDDE